MKLRTVSVRDQWPRLNRRVSWSFQKFSHEKRLPTESRLPSIGDRDPAGQYAPVSYNMKLPRAFLDTETGALARKQIEWHAIDASATVGESRRHQPGSSGARANRRGCVLDWRR